VVTDGPVTIPVAGAPDWSPVNFDGLFQGPMILKKALAFSVNTIAARLIGKTGPGAVIETARACGIESPLEAVYSLALGTSGVTPLEMASAFAVFAAGGVRHEPVLIRRVEDSLGRVLHEHIVHGTQVLDPLTVYQLVDMMRAAVDQGSGHPVRKQGFLRPAAGKTGTTDGHVDAWFTGFTPSLSACVWTGFDRGRSLSTPSGRGLTGGTCAAPIWADFMDKALEGEPVRDFPIPRGLRFETVEAGTGCPAAPETGLERYTVPLKPDQSLCRELVP
jgi:penicillin-binding protein 1A